MTEYTALALYGLVLIATVAWQGSAASKLHGLDYNASARDEQKPLTGIAGRLKRAHDNSMVAMILFAPAILIIGQTEQNSGFTAFLAWIFLIARIAYVPVYAAGIPFVRSIIWAVGALSTLLLYLIAL